MIVANTRVLAVALAILQLGSFIPVAGATHISPPLPERLPELPHAEPTNDCIGVAIAPAILARLQDAGSIGFRDREGVPSLCSLDGRPMDDWVNLVRQMDAALENYRNVTFELERQYESRLEYTVPDGACVPGDRVGQRAPYACPVIRPQVTLLSDRFDGRRLGGFGDWTVITDGAAAPAWREAVTTTNNGTQHTWRFGDQDGYARGAHQWLVSPQIDLGAVRADSDLASLLVFAYQQARGSLRSLCESPGGGTGNPVYALCAGNPDLPSYAVLTTLIDAYEDAMDQHTRGLLVGQHAATLSITFRMNLAEQEDGVRVWLWAGEEAPTRVQLYDLRDFGREPRETRCTPAIATQQLQNDPIMGPNACHEVPTQGGAAWLLHENGLPGDPTAAFTMEDLVALPNRPFALTGDVRDFTTLTVPLTKFVGQRVWLLFEVATTPDVGRGEDYFGDKSRFPRQESFGFELASVRAVGDAWPRNVRLNDVSSAFTRMPADNPYGDGRDIRTTLPPGEDIVARVHNAGEHVENMTVRLTFRENAYDGNVPVGGYEDFGDEVSVRVVNMRPGETREVRVPWPKDLTEANLYHVSANLTVDDLRQLPPISNATEYTEPSAVPVRVRNQAEDDGNATRGLLVRAYTDHDLLPVHYPPGERGPAFEVCKTFSLLHGCEPLYVAAKGERRILLVGVTNAGSVPEDASAVLDLRLDGADKSSIIQGGPVRPLSDLLPGETRAVTWELLPADAGAYKATVYLRLANGTVVGDPVSRLVFVQRSTGLVCFDDMADSRECGASFSSTRPEGLRGENVTASAVGPDGALYVATATTSTTGELWHQSPDGEWTLLEDLSQAGLNGRLPAPRADVGFGSIRDIAVGPDGTLYLAGDNMTLLARPPAGAGDLRAIHTPAPPPAGLAAYSGADRLTVEPGQNVTLTGAALGGQAPYVSAWSVDKGPEGHDGAFLDALAMVTNFTANVTGEYTLRLMVTDAAGATHNSTTTLLVSSVPTCIRKSGTLVGGGRVSTDGADAGMGAADLRCLFVTDAPAGADGKVNAEIHVANRSLRPDDLPTTYWLNFTVQGVDFGGSFDWRTDNTTSAFRSTRDTFTATVTPQSYGFLVSFTKRDALLVSEDFVMENVRVESCASACSRHDALPVSSYALNADTTPPGRVTGLRATPDLRRPDAIDLAWSPVAGAAGYVVERALGPAGPWAVVADATDTFYRDTKVQPDRAYAYRVLARDDAVTDVEQRDNVGLPSDVVTAAARVPRPDHRAVAHWNGTLFVGGLLGEMWWHNTTSDQMEPFRLHLQRGVEPGTVAVTNHVRDFVASPDGKRLYVATAAGGVFVNEGRTAAWRTAGWDEAFTPYPHTYDLDALAVHDGDVYAAGRGASGGVLLVSNATHAFRFADAPEVGGRRPGIVALASADDDRLFVVTDDPNAPIAACGACHSGDEWTFPAIPLPSIVQDSVVRRANVLSIAGAAGRTVAIAEGGVVLDYAQRGEYANEDDWSVQPTLRVNNGTAWELRGDVGPDQSLRLEPAGGLVQGWTQLRVTADHHLASTSRPTHLRVFWLPVENVNPAGGVIQTGATLCNAGCPNATLDVVAVERTFTKPSPSSAWERTQFILNGPRQSDTGVDLLPVFTAVEFFVEGGSKTFWAVDGVLVEGWFPGRGWVEILSYRGVDQKNANVRIVGTSGGNAVEGVWREVREPFDIDTVSAWHLSQDLADRPVWVLNNEVYPGEAGGSAPRLLNNWDTRLLSPIVDLSEAHDPVISFRHQYAFKTRIFKDQTGTVVEPGDGGWVEVQYEKRGEECGSADPDARCWSRFYTVCPDQPDDPTLDSPRFPAYPNMCKAGTGYPRLRDLGFEGAKLDTGDATDPYGHGIGPGLPGDSGTAANIDRRPAQSFWGRSVLPDPTGVITGARDTSQYEEVQITLRDQLILDENGNPVDLAGRRIRVGFHGLTANDEQPQPKWNYKDGYQLGNTPTTFPGEGWYITDFKVRGADQLGMDLRATNMTLDVGYEWVTLGVGPGTRVPVNVTVENRGLFEVGGYTGVLVVNRVKDAALGLVEEVGRFPLAQQPLLEPGKSRNHTLMWTVPEEEGARYVVEFTASPIGIGRDEDFTDNVATIGSLSLPVPAQTRPGYTAVVSVSPADATKDITRYVAISLRNSGNVVLGDAEEGFQHYFRVTRRIVQLGTQETAATQDCDAWREQFRLTGRTGPLVDCRTWNTTVPVLFGTEQSLASLSSEFNPATDLFWKPPTSADYRVTVTVELLRRPVAALPHEADPAVGILGGSAERIVRSFDTYLFDDAETGPRGFSIKGEWEFEPGWGEQEPGFRSSRSYGIGDPVLFRYTADIDASLITPIVDLGTARSARFAIYHRYDFEPGYDGGVIEASIDGGKTWRRLTPIPDKDNGLPNGYPDTPVSATSPLHLTGDPANKTFAFTGDSSQLPRASDGWILSVFDLTEYPDISTKDVPYELFDSGALATYKNNGTKIEGPTYPTASNRTYFDTTWNVGRTDQYRYWEVQNLTEDVIRPRGGAGDDFWWSGSMSLQDDFLRPIENTWLQINVTPAVQQVQEGDRVVVEWWEWLDRTNLGPDKHMAEVPKVELRPDARATRGVFTWNAPGALPQNYHFNLTPPSILAREGNWMLLQSDITEWVRQQGDLPPITNVSFVYAPVKTPPGYDPGLESSAENVKRDANNSERYVARWHDDRGFVVDEFTIRASKVIGGQEYDVRVLMDEERAWQNAAVMRCANDIANDDQIWVKLPCTKANTSPPKKMIGVDNNTRVPATPAYGRTWINTTWVPGVTSQWQVVPVKDEKGHRWDNLPATGEEPKAWYTGPICESNAGQPYEMYDPRLCLLPGEESRLVTPAFDLSTIAGTNADLVFTHRYGFHMDAVDGSNYPFASGGAVEIQVFDEQTQTWSNWTQLYPLPDAIYWPEGDTNASKEGQVARLGPRALKEIAAPAMLGLRGGYSAFTVNETRDDSGRTVRRDAPFQPIRHYDPETRSFVDVQFLYSGTSKDAGGKEGGWVDARFPLSDYLGKTVRVGFHVSVSGLPRTTQAANKFALHNPDGELPGKENYYAGGWWVKDVAVVGKVLHGAPVQLRARAVTDGNVHEGRWQIDDVGIYGSHYGQNLGVFHDATKAYGGMEGRSVQIPLTIRNLGESVRDNVAIEVRELSVGAKRLRLNGTDAPLIERLPDEPDIVRLSGFSLAPGQAVTTTLNVTVLPGLHADRDSNIEVFVELREYNTEEERFVKIAMNEVQGFLERRIPFTAERYPIVNLTAARSLTTTPLHGEPLTVAVDAWNEGFETVRLNLTCTAARHAGYEPVNHANGNDDRPIVGATSPCERVSGPENLTPGERATLTYRIVPDAPGALHVEWAGSYQAADRVVEIQTPAKLAVLVGRPPLLFSEGFDTQDAVTKGWMPDTSSPQDGSTPPTWSYARGRASPGALLLGVNETFVANGGSYQDACGTVCKAVTDPIDFHNFTDEDVQLTFWHMDRLAKHDGAQVSWQVLLDERRSQLASSWSTVHCVLYPRGGYDAGHPVMSHVQQAQSDPPTDQVMYPPWMDGASHTSPAFPGDRPMFFTSESFEDTWSFATFDLKSQSCANPSDPTNNITVLGNTVRFVFAVYAGSVQSGTLSRGQGHGFLVDDVAITLSRLTLRPETEQRALLLDNTTKGFHLVLGNLASQPDLVKLEVDEGNSSAPAGAIRVPDEPILLPAGAKDQLVRVDVTLPRDPSLLPTQFRVRLLARSVLDPSSVAPADLVLDFQPRQWAELAVSVVPPTLAVQEGTDTFLPITVENTGVVASADSIVRITDTWSGGSQVTELDLPSMPSYFQDAEDALRVLEFRWRPPTGSIGLHTLTFEVDPHLRGEEYTRTNNVLTVQVPVAELLVPDVDVSAADALRLRNAVGQTLAPVKEGGVTRFESAAGELVTLEVKVRNPGRAAATNVDVRAFIGPLSLPAKNVPYIGPGEEVSLTFNWVAQKGEYPLEVVARSEQVEASSANNRNPAQGINLLVVKGYEVQVTLPPLDGILEPGTEVKVPVNVTNVGNAGEEIRLVPRVPEGWSATMARESLFLRAGETFATTLTVVVPADAVAGEHFISVDAIARENPMKAASASVRSHVRAFYGGTAEALPVMGAPPVLSLPITLRNEGNSLDPWTVVVHLPPGWTSVQPQPLRPSVPAHGSLTVTLDVRVPESTPPGERQLGVKVTLPDGTRRDAVLRVDVRELRAAAATLADDRPREAQGALAYPVVLQNTGNVAKPFDLVLLTAPAGVDVSVTPSRFELQPGAKAVATLLVKPQPGVAPGAYQIDAFTAFEGVPPDTSEGRLNLQRLQLSVVRPDLRAGQLDYAKAGVDAGERVVVKVPISNEGQGTVSDLPVHLFVDDVFMGETRIARLAPGERRDVTLNWTALPGEHTVTAVVDPWRDTVDPDAEDNAVSALVQVESSAASGLVGGARVPMGGAWLTLLAAVAAALVVTPLVGARRPPR